MATTPPAAIRARTPPTPLHGPQYDGYEPYSPRRSRRSTAQRNPYSSLNAERSPRTALARNTTPPTTAKRARLSHAPPQLSSPPSSPASPVTRHALHKTPRKQAANLGRAANGTLSDSDGPAHSLAPANIDPTTMLPTPSKTPKKQPASVVTARILSFQPGSPSDVMPISRKITKQNSRHYAGTAGFELYDSDSHIGRSHEIEIYTDPNARVPEMDESEDNPFVGPKRPNVRPQRRRNNKSAAELERGQRMNEAVRRGEGVTYVFRGRTIFRKFENEDEAHEASAVNSDLGSTAEQRRLKHYAGAAAQRPLTRSAIKPRLLFPSEEERLERERLAQEADEEAVTDIEMSNAASPANASVEDEVVTPVLDQFNQVTPPATGRAKRLKKNSNGNEDRTAMLLSQDMSGVSAELDASASSAACVVAKQGKSRSPFESWPRTKSGSAKKRANDDATEQEMGSGKRTRGRLAGGDA